MAKTAAELMAELANDKQYQAKKTEKEKQINELKRIFEQDEKKLVFDINSNGISVKSVWDLVNTQNDYYEAVPVLIEHLKIKHHPKILAGIARSLAIPKLTDNDDLWLTLVSLYRVTPSDAQIDIPEERGAQQSIAVALEALADNTRVKDLEKIIAEQPAGDSVDWLKDKLRAINRVYSTDHLNSQPGSNDLS
ncbi:MAG: hypothetical protein HRU04_24050 [Oceanospirillaceae bacterium]|nr:hypothetical protein [Oceanospirillaceae bacterium]